MVHFSARPVSGRGQGRTKLEVARHTGHVCRRFRLARLGGGGERNQLMRQLAQKTCTHWESMPSGWPSAMDSRQMAHSRSRMATEARLCWEERGNGGGGGKLGRCLLLLAVVVVAIGGGSGSDGDLPSCGLPLLRRLDARQVGGGVLLVEVLQVDQLLHAEVDALGALRNGQAVRGVGELAEAAAALTVRNGGAREQVDHPLLDGLLAFAEQGADAGSRRHLLQLLLLLLLHPGAVRRVAKRAVDHLAVGRLEEVAVSRTAEGGQNLAHRILIRH
ncbi:hypothetical protein TYRP_012627 [Tyrophagus putrescentiae]|nr:hypothetical protein TYRP_012627 [Tyrophagus putrescentiae]